MSVITEDIAARLRARGYDATHGSWDIGESLSETTDFVVVSAILIVGWRYPGNDGDWKWDDRPAYLIDKGVDPPDRDTQSPSSGSWRRWEWVPSRPGAPIEHPRDNATTEQLALWVHNRLPTPDSPTVLLYRHPRDYAHNPDLSAELDGYPRPSTWPWTADWEKAWAEYDERRHR